MARLRAGQIHALSSHNLAIGPPGRAYPVYYVRIAKEWLSRIVGRLTNYSYELEKFTFVHARGSVRAQQFELKIDYLEGG